MVKWVFDSERNGLEFRVIKEDSESFTGKYQGQGMSFTLPKSRFE